MDPLEFLRQQAEERLRQRERILEHIRRPPTLLPVFVSRSGEREAVVHPYAGDGGRKYQVTYWDALGPVGDTVTHDLTYIADGLISGGYSPTDSPRWIK